jgi:hypothetical protein
MTVALRSRRAVSAGLALVALALLAPTRDARGALTGDEQKLVALWTAPDGLVLTGAGSDTPRTRAANMLLRGRPELIGARLSHLRALLGRPITVSARTGAMQYRVSVRARPGDASCTRYLTVLVPPRHRFRVGGFVMSTEHCSDGSSRRPLPTR